MAEGLASAVSVPEKDPVASPPAEETNLKRKLSITDPDNKRRRLSSSHDDGDREGPGPAPESSRADDRRRPSTDAAESGAPEKEGGRGDDRKSSTTAAARPVRRDEERKRGQRLFGALLGTLSQSSTSASQRRRADIEQRQQDKLKLQDKEYDGLKQQRRDERVAIRKKEQRVYEEESMQTRHSNLLSMAHFLKTRTEPVLYYKPWQLRSSDEDTIREQITKTEQTIAREVADFKTRYPPPDHSNEQPTASKQDETTPPAKQETEGKAEKQPTTTTTTTMTEQAPAPLPESAPKETDQSHDAKGTVTPAATAATATTTTTHAASDTVGSETTNRDQSSGDPARSIDKPPTTSTSAASTNPGQHQHQHPVDDVDAHPDDGGEVVEEDKEDTVIY